MIESADKLDAAARILVVDDEFVILETLRVLLSVEGYNPVAVRDGQKALHMLETEHFDMMITDLRMNPVDGMELLEAARSHSPDMPTVMLTAFGSPDAVTRARELGVKAFLDKPFKPDQVYGAITSALSRS